MEFYKPRPDDLALTHTPVGDFKRQVVCAANKYGDKIVLGVRHFCPLMCQHLEALGLDGGLEEHEQGFVDQWGNFMTRKEALHVLKTNGRFIRDDQYQSETLYSENLY